MRHIIILILFGCLISCNINNDSVFRCNNEKKFVTFNNVIPFSIDSIKSYKDFRIYSDKIRDTMKSSILQYGLLFNCKDSSFIPSLDSFNNLIVPCFRINSNIFCNKTIKPELDLYLTKLDTLEIIMDNNVFVYKISTMSNDIKNYLDSFYLKKFSKTIEYKNKYKTWTNFCINDSFRFNDDFRVVFNIILSSYNKSLKDAIKKNYAKEICNLDDKKCRELIDFLHFRLYVNDFDIRKLQVMVKFTD